MSKDKKEVKEIKVEFHPVNDSQLDKITVTANDEAIELLKRVVVKRPQREDKVMAVGETRYKRLRIKNMVKRNFERIIFLWSRDLLTTGKFEFQGNIQDFERIENCLENHEMLKKLVNTISKYKHRSIQFNISGADND